jgi:PST family polysaccharide transporter
MRTDTAPPLRAQAVKSAAWYGVTRLWSQLLSWGVSIMLARLLMPADYGLFAIALSITMLLELLQDFGLGTALVQRQGLTRPQINAVFWVVMASSLTITAGTFLAADALSAFYAEPSLTWALRVLCLTFLLNSVGMVPYSLLTRALNLRHRSLADVTGSTAGAVASLILAYLGYGVWALVLGQLTRSLVIACMLFALSRWVPGLDVTREGLGDLLLFGVRIAGMHVVGNLAPTVSVFVLARVLGGAAVGLFSMAQGLAEAPHRISTAIINQVSFPVFSRLQGQPEMLASYFLNISKYLAVVSLPIQAGLVLVAPDLIPVLLSAKWEAMIVPFQIVCVESAVVVLTLAASPLLTALGKANLLLARSFLSVCAMVTATLVGVPFGLVGVAVARVVAMVPLRLTLLVPCLWALAVPMRTYLRNLVSPMLATALMSAAVLTVRHTLPSDARPIERLGVSVLVGAVTYVVAILLLDRTVGTDLRHVAKDLLSTSKA